MRTASKSVTFSGLRCDDHILKLRPCRMFPKILLVGGDEKQLEVVHDHLYEHFGLDYRIASQHYATQFMWHRLKLKYNYKTDYDCWRDRHNHGSEWLQEIEAYNRSYPARNGRLIWAEYPVYSGIRDINEFRVLKARKMFDISLWIPGLVDPDTLSVIPSVADHILNGEERLQKQLNEIILK